MDNFQNISNNSSSISFPDMPSSDNVVHSYNANSRDSNFLLDENNNNVNYINFKNGVTSDLKEYYDNFYEDN